MKIKKILSCLCSVAIICTMFTVFSVSASAEGTAIEVQTFAELQTVMGTATIPTVINIMADIMGGSYINMGNGKNITINLNSHTVQCEFDSTGTPSTLTIHGSGTVKGMNRESGNNCVDFRGGSKLIADNVKFFGGDATAENGYGGYGIYILNSTATLNNCYVSGGKSMGTAANMSAITSFEESIVYAKNCTFIRGSGGSGSNYGTVPNIIYDLDSKAKIEIDDIQKSPIVIGSGYIYKVSGNVITNADGEPVIADTPVTANTTIPAPTYTVTIPVGVDFGDVKGAIEKYRNEATDKSGENINVKEEITISATGVDNLFDGKTISVSIGTTGVKTTITGNENTINCALFKGEAPYTEGSEFANFVNDVDLVNGTENKQTGYVSINRCDITKTADYTGILTFTIAIKEAE